MIRYLVCKEIGLQVTLNRIIKKKRPHFSNHRLVVYVMQTKQS